MRRLELERLIRHFVPPSPRGEGFLSVRFHTAAESPHGGKLHKVAKLYTAAEKGVESGNRRFSGEGVC